MSLDEVSTQDSYNVMPNGQTVGQYIEPQLETIHRTGELPRMLPGGGRKD